MIPTFLFLKVSLFFNTAAKGREQDGSQIIFNRSQIIFIDSIISSSVIRIIDLTSFLIIGKFLSPS